MGDNGFMFGEHGLIDKGKILLIEREWFIVT
jgi:hypothetical protein